MSACQAFLANLVPQFCQWIVIAHSDAGMLPSPTLTQSASPNSGSWLGRCADRCAAYCFLCVLGPEAWPIVFSALSSVSGPTWPTPRKPSSLRFWGSPGDPNFGTFFQTAFPSKSSINSWTRCCVEIRSCGRLFSDLPRSQYKMSFNVSVLFCWTSPP